MPPHLTRTFFCNSGAEAVENAIKIARFRTGRQNIIAFEARPRAGREGAQGSRAGDHGGCRGRGTEGGLCAVRARTCDLASLTGSSVRCVVGAGTLMLGPWLPAPLPPPAFLPLPTCSPELSPLLAVAPSPSLPVLSPHPSPPRPQGGFHGRTCAAMAVTSSKTIYRQFFGPLMPGAFIAPYPYCLHCPTQRERGYSGYPMRPDVAPFGAESDRVCCNAPLDVRPPGARALP